jgi:hypothetical protein
MAIIFYPTVESRSNVCMSFWRSFSLSCYRILTRWRGGMVGQNWAMGQNGHNFRFASWIAFDPTFWLRSNFFHGCYRIVTRWRGGLVTQNWATGQNGHNFRSDRWIALKYLHEFLETIFLGVAMESELSDEVVWSARLQERVQKAITFDQTVVSRSNF